MLNIVASNEHRQYRLWAVELDDGYAPRVRLDRPNIHVGVTVSGAEERIARLRQRGNAADQELGGRVRVVARPDGCSMRLHEFDPEWIGPDPLVLTA